MKLLIKSLLARIKKIFVKKPKKLHWVVFGSVLLSLTISLLTGLVSNDTKKEKAADYVANVVKNNTVGSNYLGITVERLQSNSNFSAQDNDSEFRRLYGVFKQERATFAAGYNLDKRYSVTVGCFESDENQSIMYVGQSVSIPYENGHKHDPYPYVFMFPLIRDEGIWQNCLSISKSRATEMLLKLFPEKKESDFTESDYKQYVVGKRTSITISTSDFSQTHTEEYTIQNIYYEQDYYYKCINEVVGDFVIFSEFFRPKYSENNYVPSQRLYFFTDYAYQTKYFMDYLNNVYTSSEYHFDVVENNIVKGKIDKKAILQFRDFDVFNKTSTFETIFIIISIALTFASIALFIISEINKNKLSVILCLVSVFAPYLIFKLLYIITGNISLFSITGARTNGILMIVYILAIIFVCVFEIAVKKKRDSHGTADVEI